MKYILLFMFLFINTQLCYAFDYKNACHYIDNINGLKTSEYKISNSLVFFWKILYIINVKNKKGRNRKWNF